MRITSFYMSKDVICQKMVLEGAKITFLLKYEFHHDITNIEVTIKYIPMVHFFVRDYDFASRPRMKIKFLYHKKTAG